MDYSKYAKYSQKELKKKAVLIFNTWIRKRDDGLGCISCGSLNQIQAGHFYSAGKHDSMRFEEDNVNSQCKHCNYFMSGNLLNYRKNLINKIGLERVERLDMLAEMNKRTRNHKWDRFTLIHIIEKYKPCKKKLSQQSK